MNNLTPTQKQQFQRDAEALLNNNTVAERFAYLYFRWQDEKEYEDIKEYAKNFEEVLPEGWEVISANKRPFGFKIKHITTGLVSNMSKTRRDTLTLKW